MEGVWSTWLLSVTGVMRTDEPVMSNHWVKPAAGGTLVEVFDLYPARRGLRIRWADLSTDGSERCTMRS